MIFAITLANRGILGLHFHLVYQMRELYLCRDHTRFTATAVKAAFTRKLGGYA